MKPDRQAEPDPRVAREPGRGAKPGYLDDDQILFSVRHSGELDAPRTGQIEAFIAQLLKETLANQRGRQGQPGQQRLARASVRIDPNPITFEVEDEQRLSVMAGRIEGADSAAVPLINLLNRQLREPRRIDDVTQLEAAIPNWITGATGDVIIRGGPGGTPHPAPDGSYERAAFHGQEGVYQRWERRPNEGEGIQVVVLDTAPEAAVLDRARADSRNNELLQALSAPLFEIMDVGLHRPSAGHRLLPHDAPTDGAGHPLGTSKVVGYDVEMSDHGTFVAGVIHMIAPRAEIRLIRVLNNYGVGDLRALFAGLALAAQLKDRRPMVVNCSLTLAIPPGRVTDLTGIWDSRMRTLEEVCSMLAGKGNTAPRVLVAAAGNDSRMLGAGNHRGPGYPAALDSVVGVAALGDAKTPASYSNRADTDLSMRELRRAGIATFGGFDRAPEEGVLGLFTADYFPDGAANKYGWAYWAGTSFAAPVISGIVANGLSTGLDADTTLAGIYAEALPPSPLDPDTLVGEALEVRQGQ